MPMVANTAGTRAALEFRGSFELFTVGTLTQHPGGLRGRSLPAKPQACQAAAAPDVYRSRRCASMPPRAQCGDNSYNTGGMVLDAKGVCVREIKCLLGNQCEQLRREPTEAFDPATIKRKSDALCDAMRKAKPRVCSATGRLTHYGQPEGKGDIDCLQVKL